MIGNNPPPVNRVQRPTVNFGNGAAAMAGAVSASSSSISPIAGLSFIAGVIGFEAYQRLKHKQQLQQDIFTPTAFNSSSSRPLRFGGGNIFDGEFDGDDALAGAAAGVATKFLKASKEREEKLSRYGRPRKLDEADALMRRAAKSTGSSRQHLHNQAIVDMEKAAHRTPLDTYNRSYAE